MNLSAKESSANLRRRIIEKRKSLASTEIEILSRKITTRLSEALERAGKTGLRVALYRPQPSEVLVTLLEPTLLSGGARLFFPRVRDRAAKLLEFVEVPSSSLNDLQWKIGPYGIEEPHPELNGCDPSELAVVLVPGVAFGKKGERIGMGAGYYDRFFADRAPQALRVALAFDFQVEDEVEQNTWDQPVHWIMTEKRDIRSERAENWLADQAT